MTLMNSIFAGGAKLHDQATGAGFLTAAAMIGVLTLLYLGEVVARYGFGHPTSWTQDAANYLLCAATALAIPEVARRGDHVSVAFLGDMLPKTFQQFHKQTTDLVAGVAAALAAAASAMAGMRAASDGVLTQASLSIPKFWLFALCAYSFASASLHFFRRTVSPSGTGA